MLNWNRLIFSIVLSVWTEIGLSSSVLHPSDLGPGRKATTALSLQEDQKMRIKIGLLSRDPEQHVIRHVIKKFYH